jgi:serine/threonine-protein kinase
MSGKSSPLASTGTYALLGVLGRGGMGEVYLGRMTTSGAFSRLVAIKQLYPHVAEDPKALGTFLDEARLSAQVRHVNVVSAIDVVSTGGRVSLIQEYVEGESIAALLRALGPPESAPFPIDVAMTIAMGMLRGLAAVHSARSDTGQPLDIVHRDISPQNILVGVDGIARIADFGIASAASRLVETTERGTLRGKTAYMAPEQLRGRPATSLVDVYAAGVVLWEMLTGRRLIETTPDHGLMIARILAGGFAPPSQHRADVPARLDEIVLRALSSDLGRRYSSAAEMLEDLEALPSASVDRVGAFVRTTAREGLERRAELVRASPPTDDFRPLEDVLAELQISKAADVPIRPTPTPPGPSATSTLPSTQAAVGEVRARPPGSSRSRRMAGVAFGIAMVGVLIALVSRSSSKRPAEDTAGSEASAREAATANVTMTSLPATSAVTTAPALVSAAPALAESRTAASGESGGPRPSGGRGRAAGHATRGTAHPPAPAPTRPTQPPSPPSRAGDPEAVVDPRDHR